MTAHKAALRYATAHTSLVNLPLSIYGRLVSSNTTPQSIVIKLSSPALKQPVFLGWSGLSSRPVPPTSAGSARTSPDTIELDPVVAAQYGLQENATVSIELIRYYPTATAVNVEPVDASDWEILELQAQHIEQDMLSQVRAAAPGQVICVWVGPAGKTKSPVHFRVTSIQPEEEAVRLSMDSEVIVAPKPRFVRSNQPAPTSSEAPLTRKKHHNHHRSKASAKSAPTGDDKALASARSKVLRVMPLDVQITALPNDSTEEPEFYINPLNYHLFEAAFPSTRCTARVVQKPSSSNEKQETTKKLKCSAYFKSCPAVPVSSVWIPASQKEFRQNLELDHVNGCELLRFTPGTVVQTNGHPTSPVTEKAQPDGVVSSVNGVQSRQNTLAGVDKLLESAIDYVAVALQVWNGLGPSNATLPVPASGMLVCGATGAGKSSFMHEVATKVRQDPRSMAYTHFVDCSKHADDRISKIQELFESWFSLCKFHFPSVLLLDNLDKLVPAEVEHIDPFRSQHIAALFIAAVKRATSARPIIVVASVANQSSFHGSLLQSHVMGGEKIMLKAPSKDARRAILDELLKRKTERPDSSLVAKGVDLISISTQTDGYLPADLQDLVDRAVHVAVKRAHTEYLTRSSQSSDVKFEVTLADFEAAQKDFTPISLRDIKLQKSTVAWSDIGGLHETRRVLRETLEWPTKYAAIFANCPLRLRSGLLLYGFPGCGKTLLASAVAKECGLNFISVKGPEILNKYIGASEKSVRDLFERAQAAKPCVLFFDEFDSIAPKRGHDSTGVTDRVVNQLLTQMDGAEGLEGVYILAATSRPDLIDPALLRPGRLDKSLLCAMPSLTDRLEIMKACTTKITISSEVDLEELARQTEGFTGADLQALVYNAHLETVHSSIVENEVGGSEVVGEPFEYTSTKNQGKTLSRAEEAQVVKRLETIVENLDAQLRTSAQSADDKPKMAKPKSVVEQSHLLRALSTARPSVPREEVARLGRIYRDFVAGRSAGGLPAGESISDEIGGRSSLM